MRVLLVNQYAPPDQSPTARLVGDLAQFLRASGHVVDLVADNARYRGHHQRAGSRLARELKSLASITLRLVRAERPDLIVALSSPPCLLFGAAFAGVLRGIPVAHWAMDLYPDLAVSLGELRTSALISFFRAIMRWSYKRCRFIVALDEDMAARLSNGYGVAAKVLPPWPPVASGTEQPAIRVPPGAEIAAAKWTWLYSGNLGRAHEWKILIDAQSELERRRLPIQLLFEGGGAQWEEAKRYARQQQLQACDWTGYVSEAESAVTFGASGLIVATQRLEAQGLLWPSKLARVLAADKPLLWVGPRNGAIARSLNGRAFTACFEREDISGVVDWIQELFQDPTAPTGTGQASLETLGRIRDERCVVFGEWIASAACSRDR